MSPVVTPGFYLLAPWVDRPIKRRRSSKTLQVGSSDSFVPSRPADEISGGALVSAPLDASDCVDGAASSDVLSLVFADPPSAFDARMEAGL